MTTDGAFIEMVHRTIRARYPGCPWPLTATMRFEVEMGGDSLSFVEVVVELEKQFGVTLPDDLAGGVRTVGELTEVVRACVNPVRPPEGG